MKPYDWLAKACVTVGSMRWMRVLNCFIGCGRRVSWIPLTTLCNSTRVLIRRRRVWVCRRRSGGPGLSIWRLRGGLGIGLMVGLRGWGYEYFAVVGCGWGVGFGGGYRR